MQKFSFYGNTVNGCVTDRQSRKKLISYGSYEKTSDKQILVSEILICMKLVAESKTSSKGGLVDCCGAAR